MIQGIYTASTGMTALIQKQDQIANNLANINTTGFKQSGLFLKEYQKYVANDQQQPFANVDIKADEVYIDYTEGAMNSTGQPLDLCLKGSGFFSVMTADGVQYTRNGNFSINADGFIVTSDGSKILSTDGYTRLNRNEPVTITEKGEIIQNNATKGWLRISDFQKPYKLLRVGESRFKPEMPDTKAIDVVTFSVRQGYLESSNVGTIKNMVEMIATYRNFEADQKAMLAQDDTLEKAVNQVGKV